MYASGKHCQAAQRWCLELTSGFPRRGRSPLCGMLNCGFGLYNEKSLENSFLPTDPVLVVHGGAWAIPDDMVEGHLHGVRNALATGWRVLERGGAALDAIDPYDPAAFNNQANAPTTLPTTAARVLHGNEPAK